MDKLRLSGAVFAFLIAVLSTHANASLIVPDGLSPGDAYHVIFVSSTFRDATSTDIADYDAHVQTAAETAGIGVSDGINWLAVGSTETVDAINHLAPLFPEQTQTPIYNQNGDLVASSFDSIWSDQFLLAPVRYDEEGNITSGHVWTGTAVDGTGENPNELGTLDSRSGVGNGGLGDVNWIEGTIVLKAVNLPLYGISSQILVSNVPLPTAAWLFGSGLLGLVGMARRRKA